MKIYKTSEAVRRKAIERYWKNPAKHRQEVDTRRLANLEAHNAKKRAIYEANREQERAKLRERYWRDPDKARSARKASHRKHAAVRNQARRAKRAADPAKASAEARQWRQERWARDPDRERRIERQAYQHRHAHEMGAPVVDLTHAQWMEIQEMQKHRCYYCGKRCKGKLTQDHILPLSQGGSHTLHNVIGACQSCNARKWTKPPPIPVQPLLLTVAPAKKRKA